MTRQPTEGEMLIWWLKRHPEVRVLLPPKEERTPPDSEPKSPRPPIRSV